MIDLQLSLQCCDTVAQMQTYSFKRKGTVPISSLAKSVVVGRLMFLYYCHITQTHIPLVSFYIPLGVIERAHGHPLFCFIHFASYTVDVEIKQLDSLTLYCTI